jgi:hypothetical protein
MRFFFDGKPCGSGQGIPLPPEAEFYLGSSGRKHYAAAVLDEARVYARVLDPKEIAAVYENERPKTDNEHPKAENERSKASAAKPAK